VVAYSAYSEFRKFSLFRKRKKLGSFTAALLKQSLILRFLMPWWPKALEKLFWAHLFELW